MGFAEDKFEEYLWRNIQLLHKITLHEILPHIQCLTIATQEQLRQKYELKGNQNAIWEFVNALRKRDGWVGELLHALRKCKMYNLANQLEEEYNKHLIKRPSQPFQSPAAPGRIALARADIDNGNYQQPASLPCGPTNIQKEAFSNQSHDDSRINYNPKQPQAIYSPDVNLPPHQQNQISQAEDKIQPPANPPPPVQPIRQMQPLPQMMVGPAHLVQQEAETPPFHHSYSSTDSMANIHSDVPSSSSSSSSLIQNDSIEKSVNTPIPETSPQDSYDPLSEVTKSPVQISSILAASNDLCPPMSTPSKTSWSLTPGDYQKTQVSDSPPLTSTSSPSALNLERPLSNTPRDPDIRQKQQQRPPGSLDANHSASGGRHNDVLRVSTNRPLIPASPAAARNSDRTLSSPPRDPHVQVVSPLNSTSSTSTQNVDRPLFNTPREPDVRQKRFPSPSGSPDAISSSNASRRDVSRGEIPESLPTRALSRLPRYSEVAEHPVVPGSSVRPLNRSGDENEDDMVLSKPGELVSSAELHNIQAGDLGVTEALSYNHDFLFSSESNLEISHSLPSRSLQRTQDVNANREEVEGQPAHSNTSNYQSQLNRSSTRSDHGNDEYSTTRMQPEENDMPYGNSSGSIQRNYEYNIPYLHNHQLLQASQQPEETSDAEYTDVRNLSFTFGQDASLDLMAGNTNAPLKRMPSPASGPQPEKSRNSQDLGKVSKDTDRDSKLLLTALAIAGVSLTLFLLWRTARK